jgi:hypothetical protein
VTDIIIDLRKNFWRRDAAAHREARLTLTEAAE